MPDLGAGQNHVQIDFLSLNLVLGETRRYQYKLEGAGDLVSNLLEAAAVLSTHQGPVLFQLPPSSKKDIRRLRAFLWLLPRECRAAFEFRHRSWFDDEVWAALRAHDASLCVAEGEALVSPLVATARWGYVRLRRDAYPAELLGEWAAKIRAQPWEEAFVYIKHDEGDAPGVATRLRALFE